MQRTNNRNPRTDPRTGDEFQRDGEKRLVVAANSLVRFRWDRPESAGIASLHVYDWLKWAKDAEVIHAAD